MKNPFEFFIKAVVACVVWLVAVIVLAITLAALGLAGDGEAASPLFSVVVIVVPIVLAGLVAYRVRLPKKEKTVIEQTTSIKADATADEEADRHVEEVLREIMSENTASERPVPSAGVANEPPKSEQHIDSEIEYKTYKATGIEHYLSNIMALGVDNPNYNLSKRDLVDEGLTDERIWQKEFSATKVELVPEPDNPYDKNAIKVVADGKHIAYIKKGSCTHLLKVIQEGRVLGVSAHIGGGQYKYVYQEEDDDTYTVDQGSIQYFVHLTVKEKTDK